MTYGRVGKSPGPGPDGEPSYELEPDALWAGDIRDSLASLLASRLGDAAPAALRAVMELCAAGELVPGQTLQWYREELEANIRAVYGEDKAHTDGVRLGLKLARSVLAAVLAADAEAFGELPAAADGDSRE